MAEVWENQIFAKDNVFKYTIAKNSKCWIIVKCKNDLNNVVSDNIMKDKFQNTKKWWNKESKTCFVKKMMGLNRNKLLSYVLSEQMTHIYLN